MTGPDLKPCPFCGVRPHVHDDASHSTAFFAGCYNDNCPVQPNAYGLSRAEAITAWNTRAQVDYAALPEVQALIAGAFEVAATAWFPGTAGMCQLKPENQAVIRALTPADAAAVRDALLAAEREACARIAEDAASMRCGKCGHPKNNHPYRHPFVGVAVDVAATIRRRGDST